MDLETMVRCLAEHYVWNDEVENMRILAQKLRELAERTEDQISDMEENAVKTVS